MRSLRRPILLLLSATLALQSFACSTGRVRPDPIRAVAPDELPRSLRLTLVDSSVVRVRAALREGDEIRGVGSGGQTVLIPIDQVASWEERRFSARRTIGLGAIVIVSAATVIVAVIILDAKEPLAVLNHHE